MENFKIDRCIKPKTFGEVKSVQLHNFSDASEIGYGVVTYLKMTNVDDDVHTAFMSGKSRVVPLKQVTITRLEFRAAVLAVRMDNMITTELQIALCQSAFWTDNTSVLRYIRNDTQRFQTFVANRISLIREATEETHNGITSAQN